MTPRAKELNALLEGCYQSCVDGYTEDGRSLEELHEDLAGLAMQGLMPKYIKDRSEGYDEEYFTMDCLRIADALIARLEEDK